ncbi:phosphoribosyl transferase domain protein [Metarhizium robertsii]|uniref:Phosphoribosyl transferase domain protein n=1 Tax=Metarhizium robertsii TaxID=568076 RepID=A0A0A1UN91_9HYPO|nr:phosphoribosyl transferase domain protein [Metarhizium robertsii]
MVKLLHYWYRFLDLLEEVIERHATRTTLQRLSETSDVFYILGRAQCDGYPLRRPRRVFYRTAAFSCGSGSWRRVREVVNPHRDFKIQEVTSRHAVDLSNFKRVYAKAQIVTRLRNQENLQVLAIGDSPLDLPMLKAASKAIVVTGDEHTRSRSMNDALLEAIRTRDFKAWQTLLPGTVSPRLSDALLIPQVCLKATNFVGHYSLFSAAVCILHCDRLLANIAQSCSMSLTRNALITGPALRKAHSNIRSYLAWELLSGVLGIQEYQLQRVQGHTISGYRLKYKKTTTITVLMRGGEPMALGISNTLLSAVFIYAKIPDDITKYHLNGQKTVILVDSVINSGRTIIQFIKHIRKEHKDIHIVVVAGVVQEGTIVRGHAFAGAMQDHDVCVGALRVSSNKFVGFKGTDTGHRLFSTTHMA